MFVAVDCDNFYVECERLFAPALRRRPVVVLSNNDGCVISRSGEAKALGVGMGAPLFKVRDIVETYGVEVFSSNYALYGDMSRRVMETLRTLSPEVEVYSIDEAFLRLDARAGVKPLDYAQAVRGRIGKWTGLPASVGVAPTKTLAKAAVRLAKRSGRESVCGLWGEREVEEALAGMEVEEVWGVGRRRGRVLREAGYDTALKLSRVENRAWLRRRLSVVMLRTVYELRGVPCLPLEACPPPRRSVTVSRSFGRAVTRLEDVQEALAAYAALAGERLRRSRLTASVMLVFMSTDRFDPATFCEGGAVAHLPVPTDLTPELIAHAKEAAARVFRPGRHYRKAGLTLLELAPRRPTQAGLFDRRDRARASRLMAAVDEINRRMGAGTVRFAGDGSGRERPWHTRSTRRSPRYTTNWAELPRTS